MIDTTFNYYPADITKSTPLGDITLDQFITAIKFPKKKIADTFEKIRIASEAGDEKLKAQLKQSLYSFTPCVYVKGARKYENIAHWTGLLALDFDKLPTTEYATEWKEALFSEYKFIIASWLSPSKKGVRALVKIPKVQSVAEFKEYFNGIQNVLSVYRGWDRAPQNCILPMFLSYDPQILFRQDPEEWNIRCKPSVEAPMVKQYIISDKSNHVERIIASMINKIENNGHPQLRAAAYLLGGYVGGGAIHSERALRMLESMIDGNAYLVQKAHIYKKTAKQMIQKGQREPVFLK